MGGGGGGRPYTDPTAPRVPTPPVEQPGPGGGGGGASTAASGCPEDFSAEVTDVPEARHPEALGLDPGATLPIELRDGDPAFLLSGDILGWLATNIEEVTLCLDAGWTYEAEVVAVSDEPSGPLIRTRVRGRAPG